MKNKPLLSAGQKRKPTSFAIQNDLSEQFNKYCAENAINKSQLVEIMIKKYLDKGGL